jgi:hypothetical protein
MLSDFWCLDYHSQTIKQAPCRPLIADVRFVIRNVRVQESAFAIKARQSTAAIRAAVHIRFV